MEINRKKKYQLTVWVDEQLNNELDSFIASNDGANRSSVIRRAVFEFLERQRGIDIYTKYYLNKSVKNEI